MTVLSTLPPRSQELAGAALALMDDCWDDAVGLCRSPQHDLYQLHQGEEPVHLVRETPLYALGLLMRGGAGDDERAARALAAVLALQYDEPAAVFHGTWPRAPQEPHPPQDPTEWRDYDPNWREFIGTTLSLVLDDFADRLPDGLIEAMETAIELAIEGTLRRDVPARYTNIALMRAYLLDFGGRHLRRPGWAALAEENAAEVHQLFASKGTFDEYNSPTYYGVNLYALALWRRGARSPVLRERGAEMEVALWTDVAQFYHAGLKNLCGPFDRAYSMDMTRYVGYLGLWIWDVVGQAQAPVPDLAPPVEHAWDLCPGVAIALLGSRPPADRVGQLGAFGADRGIRRTISRHPERTATAWLGQDVMIGAQHSTGRGRPSSQFHPVTMHWRAPDGTVAWLRLRGHRVEAEASVGRLSVTVPTPDPEASDGFVFELSPMDVGAIRIGPRRWELPGLTLDVDASGTLDRVVPADDGPRLHFSCPPDVGGASRPFHITLSLAG